jgi:hypothetical protein
VLETHDYHSLLSYTLDKEIDYFGHKNASSAFIEQDMTQDARSYKWCRFVPDLSTFQTSLGHDSIEYDSDALDVRGKEHKARCRLDIYYTPTTSPRLQALSLKVLPNHLQSGNSGSTVTGPASGPGDAAIGMATIANAQNINSWTPQNLKAHFGAATAQYVHGKIKTITFSAGPHGNFHGPQCFRLILEVLRGPDATNYDNVDYGEGGEGPWVDHETDCVITMDDTTGPLQTWHFTVTKNGSVVLTAQMIEWRSGGPHGGPQLILKFQ